MANGVAAKAKNERAIQRIWKSFRSKSKQKTKKHAPVKEASSRIDLYSSNSNSVSAASRKSLLRIQQAEDNASDTSSPTDHSTSSHGGTDGASPQSSPARSQSSIASTESLRGSKRDKGASEDQKEAMLRSSSGAKSIPSSKTEVVSNLNSETVELEAGVKVEDSELTTGPDYVSEEKDELKDKSSQPHESVEASETNTSATKDESSEVEDLMATSVFDCGAPDMKSLEESASSFVETSESLLTASANMIGDLNRDVIGKVSSMFGLASIPEKEAEGDASQHNDQRWLQSPDDESLEGASGEFRAEAASRNSSKQRSRRGGASKSEASSNKSTSKKSSPKRESKRNQSLPVATVHEEALDFDEKSDITESVVSEYPGRQALLENAASKSDRQTTRSEVGMDKDAPNVADCDSASHVSVRSSVMPCVDGTIELQIEEKKDDGSIRTTPSVRSWFDKLKRRETLDKADNETGVHNDASQMETQKSGVETTVSSSNTNSLTKEAAEPGAFSVVEEQASSSESQDQDRAKKASTIANSFKLWLKKKRVVKSNSNKPDKQNKKTSHGTELSPASKMNATADGSDEMRSSQDLAAQLIEKNAKASTITRSMKSWYKSKIDNENARECPTKLMGSCDVGNQTAPHSEVVPTIDGKSVKPRDPAIIVETVEEESTMSVSECSKTVASRKSASTSLCGDAKSLKSTAMAPNEAESTEKAHGEDMVKSNDDMSVDSKTRNLSAVRISRTMKTWFAGKKSNSQSKDSATENKSKITAPELRSLKDETLTVDSAGQAGSTGARYEGAESLKEGEIDALVDSARDCNELNSLSGPQTSEDRSVDTKTKNENASRITRTLKKWVISKKKKGAEKPIANERGLELLTEVEVDEASNKSVSSVLNTCKRAATIEKHGTFSEADGTLSQSNYNGDDNSLGDESESEVSEDTTTLEHKIRGPPRMSLA